MADRSDLLSHKPGPELKLDILQVTFGRPFTSADVDYFGDYFIFYERELSTLGLGQWSQFHPSPHIAAATHSDLLRVLRVLQANASSTKGTIRRELGAELAVDAEDKLDRTLELALRLWLMINVRDETRRLHTLRTPVVVWKDDWNLNSLLKETFPISDWALGAKESRLHPTFTVVFMVEICGVYLEWTDCLADHLRLDLGTKILKVFPYKEFLQNHLTSISELHEDDHV